MVLALALLQRAGIGALSVRYSVLLLPCALLPAYRTLVPCCCLVRTVRLLPELAEHFDCFAR